MVHSSVAKTAAISSLLAAALLLIPAPPSQGDDLESAWSDLIVLAGGSVPEGETMSGLLGPLPGKADHEKAGTPTAREFLDLYARADERVKLVMKRSVRARLRELARRNVVEWRRMERLLGPEGAGVHGSEFFGIPPIPEEAYHSLIFYIEWCAYSLPGSSFESTPEVRARIDRSLQACLAISSARVRTQYWDFDAVWSSMLMVYVCGGKGEDFLPGALWLYSQLRENCDLGWLPPVPADLSGRVEADGGGIFSRARGRFRSVPAGLASVTAWECGRPR